MTLYIFSRLMIQKKKLSFDDEAYKIVLNTKCDPNKVPDKLKSLFAYINDPSRIEDEFIDSLNNRVQKFNTSDWRQKQMTLAHIMENAVEAEREKINTLIQVLIQAGRIEDLLRSTEDEEYQKQLLKELNLLED